LQRRRPTAAKGHGPDWALQNKGSVAFANYLGTTKENAHKM